MAKKGFRYSLILLLGLACGHAQAQQLQGIRVHMHGAEGYAADGTLYTPQGGGPFAAIVLIPNERGITQRVSDSAARFVAQGFLVVAVDLNRGLPPDAASHSEEQSRHDVDAALSFLTAQTSVTRNAIGLVGWQSGGTCALRFAGDPRVKAIELIDPLAPLDLATGGAKPAAVFLASFTGSGAHVSRQDVHAFEEAAKALGIAAATKTYQHAEAGFDDSENTHQYRVADAKDLWQRETDFFSKTLRR